MQVPVCDPISVDFGTIFGKTIQILLTAFSRGVSICTLFLFSYNYVGIYMKKANETDSTQTDTTGNKKVEKQKKSRLSLIKQ